MKTTTEMQLVPITKLVPYVNNARTHSPEQINKLRSSLRDGASEIVKEFKSGTLSLGIDDIGSAAASDLTGATIDKNKVLISASEDGGDPVAVGFRAKKSNGKYKYYWLYRVKFGIPATNLATKGDSITFSTPTIEGTILRRNKADAGGKHPWKAEALEGDVTAAAITNWYKEVYEPTYTTTPEKQG